MIHVDYSRPEDRKKYRRWLDAAHKATLAARAAYKATGAADPKFPFEKQRLDGTTVWGAFKWHLEELFNKKCAYCESFIKHVDLGEVEHYRPKRRVDVVDPNGKRKAVVGHRGYYWLAYKPQNLLFVCQRCNKWGAKDNQFPIEEPTRRVFAPGVTLRGEPRLLLNPYLDDPEEHLEFDPKLGTVKARRGSLIGETSIKVYCLLRSDLMEERRREQANVIDHLIGRFNQSDITAVATKINDCFAGKERYSAALKAAIEGDPRTAFLAGRKPRPTNAVAEV